jgi:hypothetical protein
VTATKNAALRIPGEPTSSVLLVTAPKIAAKVKPGEPTRSVLLVTAPKNAASTKVTTGIITKNARAIQKRTVAQTITDAKISNAILFRIKSFAALVKHGLTTRTAIAIETLSAARTWVTITSTIKSSVLATRKNTVAKTTPSLTPGEQTKTNASATNAMSAALAITTKPTRSANATLKMNAAQAITGKQIFFVAGHANLNKNAVLTITMTGELTSAVLATGTNTVAKTHLTSIPTYQTLFARTAPQTRYVALDITGPLTRFVLANLSTTPRTIAVLRALSGVRTTGKFLYAAPKVTSHAAMKRRMTSANDLLLLVASI